MHSVPCLGVPLQRDRLPPHRDTASGRDDAPQSALRKAGDDLIVSCTDALRARLRDADLVARLGGDEFAVLLRTGGREQASTVADALARAVRERCHGMTVSVGVALAAPGMSADEIFVHADQAMYAAKRAGGDRSSVVN